MSVLSDSDNKAISEMQIKIDGLEKKMSMMDALVPEETKVRNLNENDLFLLKLADKNQITLNVDHVLIVNKVMNKISAPTHGINDR